MLRVGSQSFSIDMKMWSKKNLNRILDNGGQKRNSCTEDRTQNLLGAISMDSRQL